jgi:hypothetical protein
LFEVAFIAGGGDDEELITALAPLYEGDDEFSLNKLMDFKTFATLKILYTAVALVPMIVCFSLGIAGAISYNNRLLVVAVIAYWCLALLSSGNIVNGIWNASCIYYHRSLRIEIQSGIMSPLGGGTSTTSTNKQGNSFCGVCCDKVSNEIPIVPLICY